MADWYGPGEAWPAHPKSWWREALAAAQTAGWHLATYSGHTWGKVLCRRDVDEPCAKLIFSTGRAGESVARDLPKFLARCKHVEQTPPDVVGAMALLDGAALLLEAAAKCIAAQDSEAKIEELLSAVDANCEQAEGAIALPSRSEAETLEQVYELEQIQQQDILDGYVKAATAGFPATGEHGAEALTTEAEGRIEAAAAVVAGHEDEAVTAVAERIVQLRAEAAGLRREQDLQ